MSDLLESLILPSMLILAENSVSPKVNELKRNSTLGRSEEDRLHDILWKPEIRASISELGDYFLELIVDGFLFFVVDKQTQVIVPLQEELDSICHCFQHMFSERPWSHVLLHVSRLVNNHSEKREIQGRYQVKNFVCKRVCVYGIERWPSLSHN